MRKNNKMLPKTVEQIAMAIAFIIVGIMFCIGCYCAYTGYYL